MSWLQWFTVLNLSSNLLLIPPALAQEMDYFAKQKAIMAKEANLESLKTSFNTVTAEKSLDTREGAVRELLKPGVRVRGEAQNSSTQYFDLNRNQPNPNYNPYHDYMARAEAHINKDFTDGFHLGEYRYDSEGNRTLVNSSKDLISREIKDPVEREKFQKWAESVDPALEERARVVKSRAALEEFKGTLKKFENKKDAPMLASEYTALSKQLQQIGLPEEQYQNAVQALETIRAKTPGIPEYPHGQKKVGAACLARGL